jgi:hypothetical protein
MSTFRVRWSVFQHCLVPVQAIIPALESIDDLRQQSLAVSRCDPEVRDGTLHHLLMMRS